MHVATLAVLLASTFAAELETATLAGIVLDSQGQPVAAARVDISTAAPRVGRGLFCPSCYLDCRKFARTDAAGRFAIPGLDPALKFRVLISSPGKQAQLTKLIDPIFEPVEVKLADAPQGIPPERVVQGRVTDDDGVPLEGALIDPGGAQTAGRRWWGTVEVDPTVTDPQGRFSLVLPAAYLGVDVSVTADGTAGASFELMKPGEREYRLAVPAGTKVTGQLVHAGQPVSGIKIAVVQFDRSVGERPEGAAADGNRPASRLFIGAVGDTTDAEGRFVFEYLPADEDYVIFTLVGEGPQPLVITTKKFRAPASRKERDLGSLSVIAPLALAGRIELPEGVTLPEDTRITLGRDPAWDLIAGPIGKDGSFSFAGLPPETYTIRLATGGIELDPSRLKYQVLDKNAFGLRLTESIDNLAIPVAVKK
jgi:hypothetical protein